MNGFAAISRVDSPKPTMKLTMTKAGNDVRTAAGQNIKMPQA